MPESRLDMLEEQLKVLLGTADYHQAVHDINAAMELGGVLENKGFFFQLKDLYPKSMTQTGWRASFSRDGMTFSADNPQASVAVCMAVVGALADTLPENEK